RRRPSLVKASALTPWASARSRSGSPAKGPSGRGLSHSRITPSLPPAAKWPCALTATLWITSFNPVKVYRASPVAVSQTKTPSPRGVRAEGQPAYRRLVRFPRNRPGVQVLGVDVVNRPQADLPVAVGGGEQLARGMDCHAGHALAVSRERGQQVAGVGVPQPYRVVEAAGGQPVPVGGIANGGGAVRVT